MAQQKAWEEEYRRKRLITGSPEPQKDVLRYFKYLRKDKKFILEEKRVLDLGSGTGRNSNYLASLGNEVYGIEVSRTAVETAKKRAGETGLNVKYTLGSFGEPLDFKDNFFDLVLDITSSNSLNEEERNCYLKEVYRVLKPGGFFFVRALSKEGDKNAKNLLKSSPGPDEDTYFMKDLDLYEKVFTEETFRERYGKLFNIDKLTRKSGYASISGRKFKRNYILIYLSKGDNLTCSID